MPSMTSHLLRLTPVELLEATQHPFLAAAATSALSPAHLKAWLGQDRLYALSYVQFIAATLARIPIPTGPEREASLEWRAADALIDCLTNVRAEIKLFEETAAAEGWLDDICAAKPSVHTRAYQDLFAGAAAPHRPLLAALVALWATEECYLRSWRHAASKMDHGLAAKDKDAMQRVFIPNWSSPAFEALVRKLGGLVNKFGGSVEEDGWEWTEAEEAWRQVLWAEKAFWPDV